MEAGSAFTSRQLLFKELFVGTLIYVAVLGFFADYTSIVEARSFSYIFLAAVILEVLTCATLAVKDVLLGRLRDRQGFRSKAVMAFCIWFVLFSSKFVFIWAIDLILGDDVQINGFFGIFVLAALVTVVHQLVDRTFIGLGSTSGKGGR